MASPNTISFSLRQAMGTTVSLMDTTNGGGHIIGRVVYVLLDDSNQEKFNKLGGWKNIGTIEFLPFINFNDPNSDPIIAKPLGTNITKFPVENEVVIVKKFISKKAQDNIGNYSPEYYYTDVIPVFNATEQNALPDASFFKKNPNSKSVTGIYPSIGNVKRLIKAPGDITIESRRGTSIRLGSNVPGFKTPWTNTESKPIFVISHNPVQVSGSKEVRFEDINKDGTSLIMMSGHNIGFQAASFNFDSYQQKYDAPQKQNMVVTDQKVESQPNKSLQETDSAPVQKDLPVTGSIPVKVETPPSNTNKKEEDEEELPEREDLLQVDVIVEEVEVSSLSASGIGDFFEGISFSSTPGVNTTAKSFKSKAAYINSLVASSTTLNDIKFKEKLQKIADDFRIKVTDLQKVITVESAGKYEKAVLWYKSENGKIKQSNKGGPGYQPQAAGLIQFTNVSKSTIGVYSLYDVINSSALKQLDYVRKYFEANKSYVYGADIYALYGTIFYPYIVSGGRISKPDSFVLGSQKSDKAARDIARQNRGITGDKTGNTLITVGIFKRYVDSIFE